MKKIIFSLGFGLILFLAPASAGAVDKKVFESWPEAGKLLDPAQLQVPAEEKETFLPAASVSGGLDGFRRGKNNDGLWNGPLVYCKFTDQTPEFHQNLEFQWSQVPNMGPSNLAQGYGEMTVKYKDDQKILQRYWGWFIDGFREGQGELLARWTDPMAPMAENAFFYRGNFHLGRMDGRGDYVSRDLNESGEDTSIYEGEFENDPFHEDWSPPPRFSYNGEFKNDTFHGQGVMTNLATKKVIHDGQWIEGKPFKGDKVEWKNAKAVKRLQNEWAKKDERLQRQVAEWGRTGSEIRQAAGRSGHGAAGGK